MSADDLKDALKRLQLRTVDSAIQPIDFELPSLSGISTRLSSLHGKVVFLNFWATWCGPCRSEMPAIERLYETLGKSGLEIVAVDLRESRDTVASYAKELGLKFSILLDTQGRAGSDYGVSSIPTTLILDRDGMIFSAAVGARAWDSPEMLALFRRLLAARPLARDAK